jgi:hypothetical protein
MNKSILLERLRNRRNKIIIRWRSVEETLRDEQEWGMWEGGFERMVRQTVAIDRTLHRLGPDADAAPVPVPERMVAA